MIHEENVVSVSSDSSAHDVVGLMQKRDSSYCIVEDNNGSIRGLITYRELMSIFLKFKEAEELPIYIIGLDADEDWFDQTIAEDKIRRVVNRAQEIHPHMQEVRVKIDKQRKRGNRNWYQVNANVYIKTSKETLFVKEEGWDLLEAFDKVANALDKLIREKKYQPKRIDRYAPMSRYRSRARSKRNR
jgi:ribosome-associated translation inhibitor RaiA